MSSSFEEYRKRTHARSAFARSGFCRLLRGKWQSLKHSVRWDENKVKGLVIVSFVKGHMGGDEIVLLDGRRIPRPISSRSVLMPPNIRGREVGLLYPPRRGGDISVKIYQLTTEKRIRMCGGLTQVLGVALAQTDLSKIFSLKVKPPRSLVRLETDSGIIPIEITFRKRNIVSVRTEMKSYVETCSNMGSEETRIEGISMERVGNFYFVELEDLRRRYPIIDFTRNNPECLGVFERMRKERKLVKMYVIVKRTVKPGKMEAAFRFVPPDALALEGEEFACGTGTTACALYEFSHSRLPIDSKGRGQLSLKLLSRGVLPTEQCTEVELQVDNCNVSNAWFSHNHVEIIAEGKVRL